MTDWDSYESQFADTMKKIYAIIIEETGSVALSSVLTDGEFDPFTIAIQNYLKNESLKVSKTINDETKKQIRAALSQGMLDGDSVYELTQKINEVFGYASSDRAYKIAESESTRAQGYADVQAWEQSGQVEGKTWYTSEDERVCAFCGAMHGRTIALRDNFYNKGDRMVVPRPEKSDAVLNISYEDINHQPLHVRCRCVLLPVMKDLG